MGSDVMGADSSPRDAHLRRAWCAGLVRPPPPLVRRSRGRSWSWLLPCRVVPGSYEVRRTRSAGSRRQDPHHQVNGLVDAAALRGDGGHEDATEHCSLDEIEHLVGVEGGIHLAGRGGEDRGELRTYREVQPVRGGEWHLVLIRGEQSRHGGARRGCREAVLVRNEEAG